MEREAKAKAARKVEVNLADGKSISRSGNATTNTTGVGNNSDRKQSRHGSETREKGGQGLAPQQQRKPNQRPIKRKGNHHDDRKEEEAKEKEEEEEEEETIAPASSSSDTKTNNKSKLEPAAAAVTASWVPTQPLHPDAPIVHLRKKPKHLKRRIAAADAAGDKALAAALRQAETQALSAKGVRAQKWEVACRELCGEETFDKDKFARLVSKGATSKIKFLAAMGVSEEKIRDFKAEDEAKAKLAAAGGGRMVSSSLSSTSSSSGRPGPSHKLIAPDFETHGDTCNRCGKQGHWARDCNLPHADEVRRRLAGSRGGGGGGRGIRGGGRGRGRGRGRGPGRGLGRGRGRGRGR